MEQLKWDAVLDAIKLELSKDDFDNWISNLSFQSNDNFNVSLLAPSQFIKGWILTNYKTIILKHIQTQVPKIEHINITVSSFANNEKASANLGVINTHNSQTDNEVSLEKTRTIGFKLDTKYTFNNFVVGKPNEFAYAAAKRIASDTKVVFNPLFIHGGVGLGKTHLMHSIAWYILEEKQNRKFLYLSAEKFMNLYVRALSNKDMMNFKEMFRSTDVLMIDDFQFISGKDQTQEEFFHSFNSLIEQGKQIVLSADKAPSELSKIEERIISRLNAGLVADIHATSYELRVGILNSKIKQLKVKIPQEVIDYLAHNITSNVRELEGGLKRVLARQELINSKITLDVAISATEDIVKSNNRAVSVDQIQKIVAEHYSIKFSDMLSNRRLKHIALAKQIAMYLSKTLTTYSFADIGKKFGGKDHTTVLYAVKKIDELQKKNSDIEKDIIFLIKTIKKTAS